MRNAIEIHALTKRYGTLTALDEVSFEVGRGELFGLIGPDGAGKTTLFRLLATLVAPDGGTASVDGLDIVDDYKRIRERVGYMPGRFSLYPDLSVGENLAFFAALFGVEIAENYDLIAPIYRQIEPFRARRAGKLSGGMKQKLALCCALIHRPAVLLLDEPTTGVDAVSRSEFWDMLSELKGKGISMLVSTPYMDEAVRCDRVALCGANGCGKSSLLKLLLGEEIPHSGTVETMSGLVVSYVSQNTDHLRGSLTEFARTQGLDGSRFRTILRKLDVPREQFEKDLADYSSGQKKKVLLAASLCTQAHLYVWDEPLNFIDVISRMQVEDLLLACRPTLLFVEHDARFCDEIATRRIRIRRE